METYREAAVNLMTQLATEGRSYSLGGGHEWENLVERSVFGVSVYVPGGDMDCSGSVSAVYKALGLLDKYTIYQTSDMADLMVSTGYFTEHPWDDPYVMRPGDLMLRPAVGDAIGHVAMCIASDFSLAEFTTAGAGGPGVRPFYDFPWTICLELSDSIGNKTWSGTGGGTTTGGQIGVDGYWGTATTSALQRHYGTTVDGIVSHQWAPNVSANPALTSGWQCDETAAGSPMIRELQKDLGTDVDGIFGGADIYALQRRCGTVADGVLWGPSPCVKEMQRRLNAGTW